MNMALLLPDCTDIHTEDSQSLQTSVRSGLCSKSRSRLCCLGHSSMLAHSTREHTFLLTCTTAFASRSGW